MSSDCLICNKHKDHSRFPVIAEHKGWILSHFPNLADEKATKGHLLLETIRHITDLSELNETEASALGYLIKQGAKQVQAQLKAEHVYVFRINDKVAHLHFHLIPRYPNTPKDFWGLKISQWPDREIVNEGQIQELARRLKWN